MRGWLIGLGTATGLMGAAGVGLAAAGTHHAGGSVVTTAAYFLLFHAAALAAFCGVARDAADRALLLASSVIVVGTVIFSGDLAIRGLTGVILFHMAAPTGGVLMITGWLIAAVAFPLSLRRLAP